MSTQFIHKGKPCAVYLGDDGRYVVMVDGIRAGRFTSRGQKFCWISKAEGGERQREYPSIEAAAIALAEDFCQSKGKAPLSHRQPCVSGRGW